MEDTILYFGYGANRDPKMMEWITGNPNLKGKPGVLKGFKLCVQRLDQIPDTVAEAVPVQVSPRKILSNNWPKTFTSYIIKEDSQSKVHGIVWELTLQERELVRDWELIDFGWYKDIETKVTTEDGLEVSVQTEGLRDGQPIDREVNGKDYETFLNPPEDFEKVATKSRQEFLEKQKVLEKATTASGRNKELS